MRYAWLFSVLANYFILSYEIDRQKPILQTLAIIGLFTLLYLSQLAQDLVEELKKDRKN